MNIIKNSLLVVSFFVVSSLSAGQQTLALCLQAEQEVSLQNYAPALSNFYKAQKKASLSLLPKIEHAIKTILYKTGQQEDLFLEQLALYAQRCVPLIILQFLFLFLWIFLGIIFLRFLEIKNYIRNLLIVMLFVVGFLLVNQYWFSTRVRGIVMQDQTNLFIGPCVDYQIIEQLATAQQVKVLYKKEDWYKIKSNHGVGWVQAQSIDIIE